MIAAWRGTSWPYLVRFGNWNAITQQRTPIPPEAQQFRGENYVGWQSSVAMFAPGRILQVGVTTNASGVVDINGPVPTFIFRTS